MLRMFRYRIYPNREQEKALRESLSNCCFVYNQLLEVRIKVYEEEGRSFRKYDMNNLLVSLKEDHPKLAGVHSQVLQNISDRIDKAFTSFFRRLRQRKGKAGFPRFKSGRRYNSITYPQNGFNFISYDRIRISKIGDVKIKLHRDFSGKIKTLTIKRSQSGKWYAIFSCECEAIRPTFAPEGRVGIDMGLENFATLSSGERIENPRFLVESERRLKRLQRRLSRKQRGSANKRKARIQVACLHEHISNQRQDFHHKLSTYFVSRFDYIAVEDLNVKGMVKHPYLAKHIYDAGWGFFLNMLEYKAENAGIEFERKPPAGTSTRCSRCRTSVTKSLATRFHLCPNCGFYVHRDLNASINIRDIPLLKSEAKADTAGTAGIYACGDRSPPLPVSAKGSLSVKQEASPFRAG